MTAAPLLLEGPMNEPWHGSRPPDEPVTVTLPYRTAKRVLVAVVADAHRANVKGNDPGGVEQLAFVSDVIGDAIEAPVHRRFRLPTSPPLPEWRRGRVEKPRQLLWAVLAGDASEYGIWKRTVYDSDPDLPTVFVDSIRDAKEHAFGGYSVYGTARYRNDFQEILAAVRRRVHE